MRQKGSVNRILIFFIIVLSIALIYVTFIKKPSRTDQTPQTNSQNKEQNKIIIPEEYVKKNEDSANQATFVFAVPVKKQDIIGANIKYCIVSASAGAEASGRQSECKETTLANSFSLKYDETTRTLVISDPTPGEWGADSGPFRTGCAACFSTVEFSGIHTSSGQLLPRKVITVY